MQTLRKLLSILSSKHKYQCLFLVFCILIGAVLETVGVSVIIPILAFMTQKDIGATYPKIQPLLLALGNPSQKVLIAGSMILLVVFYLCKTFFMGFYNWRLKKFIRDLVGRTAYRLYSGYLRLPWSFHMQHNSAELISNINTEAGVLAFGVQSCLTFFGEGIILCSIVVLLLVISPVETLIIAGTLGFTAYAINFYVKNRLAEWGKSRQYHDRLRTQQLQQGLGCVKDVKLLGREKEFSKQYDEHNKKVVGYVAKVEAISDINRLCLELFGVMSLSLLVIVMIFNSSSLESLLPKVGLFAVAAFKLLPFINKLSISVNNMRYYLPGINKVYDELQLVKSTDNVERESHLDFNNVISINKLSYRYENSKNYTLKSISLDIPKGASVGFIGSSGAGKSTLVDLVLGLLSPSEGQILVDGVNIQNSLSGWQKRIGYVPQSIFLIDDSLRRNVALGVPDEEIDDDAVARALCAAQLEQLVDTLPLKENTIIGEHGVRLSGGQRQRIGIARALYNDPEVLVLDEATSALDNQTEEGVMRAVNALHGSKTLIIIAHRISTLSGCDRLYQLELGSLVREGNFEHVTAGV